jgi:hypothetical protein
MRTFVFDDPGHWRQRATEMRQLAGQSRDPAEKNILLEIADAYDVLATRTEAKLASKR